MNELPISLKKIVHASAEISSTQENEFTQHISFLHTVFCQVGLPRSKVKGREFMRKNGNAWLSIQSGFIDEGNGPVAQPIPYGSMPRLAMAYITTSAVQNKCREISLGHSASEFLRSLDIGTDGRRFKTMRKQMHALASCRLQLGCKGRTYNGQPIEKFNAWLVNENDSKAQYALWPGKILLSEPFYQSLVESPVPLDIRALVALKQSSLAMDIYTWFVHRLHRIEESIFVPWSALHKQFGEEYTGKYAIKNFKNPFKDQLMKARSVYPNAYVNLKDGGLLLEKSDPPIPFKPTMLETSNLN